MAKKKVALQKTSSKVLEPTHENIAREWTLGKRSGLTTMAIAEKFAMSPQNLTNRVKSLIKAGVELTPPAKRLGGADVSALNKLVKSL